MYKYDYKKKIERMHQFEQMARESAEAAKAAPTRELREEYVAKAENYAAMAEDLRFGLKHRGYLK